ncbi:hypothetical protein PPERSA_10468 [Pseudocohnilembus persalinus]|uniref:Uncharacterized protein n=1 Tax=Pseudocohnilembus persalinus TaxID=266149 RepID=A0A0V0R787_PSEPJ|nr:hypothetical protein PPERSA_10468 [Pseudocohnilembus persalinus]|eukprot:KRX10369.1 hypothetical protein PPERSA_10468 [Pseudocohnilembus persalinus]
MNQILNQKNNLLQLSVDISRVKKVKIQVTVCVGSEINWVLNFIKSFDTCIGAAYIIAEFFSQELQDSTSSNNLNKYYNLSYNFKQICKRYDEQLNNFCQFVGIAKNIL